MKSPNLLQFKYPNLYGKSPNLLPKSPNLCLTQVRKELRKSPNPNTLTLIKSPNRFEKAAQAKSPNLSDLKFSNLKRDKSPNLGKRSIRKIYFQQIANFGD